MHTRKVVEITLADGDALRVRHCEAVIDIEVDYDRCRGMAVDSSSSGELILLDEDDPARDINLNAFTIYLPIKVSR